MQAGIVYADSRAMLRGPRARAAPGQYLRAAAYRHIVGMPVDRTRRAASLRETPFMVVRTMRDGRMDLLRPAFIATGCVQDGTALRFAERIVVCDSSRFDTLLAIPL